MGLVLGVLANDDRGAGERSRTSIALIKGQPRYQLRYAGLVLRAGLEPAHLRIKGQVPSPVWLPEHWYRVAVFTRQRLPDRGSILPLNYPGPGADARLRTSNPSPIERVLYQLSYASVGCPVGFEPMPRGSQPRRASRTRRGTGAADQDRTGSLRLTVAASSLQDLGSQCRHGSDGR